MKRLLPEHGQNQLAAHLKRLPATRKRAITNSLKVVTPRVFANRLLKWFDQHGRKALPWQQNPTPYRVWVSEIMLQQTQVSTVIPYFERFIDRFPSVVALAEAKQDDVLHLWTGLGYYARARNLHKSAKQICELHRGELPEDTQALMALPGIGQSTAGAIISLSNNHWAPILDGNVKRVLARVHRIRGPVQDPQVQHHLWALSHHYTPSSSAKAFNQGMMDIGATLCTRGQPNCAACPLKSVCGAYQTQQTAHFPEPKAAGTKSTKSVYFLVLQQRMRGQQHVLLEKRPSTGIWGGLWSFPEFPTREALEDLKIIHKNQKQSQAQLSRANSGNAPDNNQAASKVQRPIKHIFTHFTLEISPVVISLEKQHNKPLGRDYARPTQWFSLATAPTVGLAAPVARLLKKLQKAEAKNTHSTEEVVTA